MLHVLHLDCSLPNPHAKP
uniref:Uncharacterized protein n=1 Tax=Arundo donax TaxID=35708 RepID=A0A0A9C658_ARUDO